MAIGVGRIRGALLFAVSIPCTSKTLSFPFSSASLPPASVGDGDGDGVISTAVSVLREHRSRSRWNYLRSLYHPAGFSPAQASGIVVRLRNKPRLALRFFLWSHRRRLCSHDLSSYAAIIHVLARSRLRSAALSLIQSAIRSHDGGADPDPDQPPEIFETLARTYRACDSAPFVFDLLIRAYLDTKKFDRAVQIARLLKSRGGIRPLVSTSNSLIRTISRARGFDAGLEIYQELFAPDDDGSRVRVSPNVQTFNTLLLAVYRDGRSDEAAEIRREMEKFGCDLNVFTYSVLMAGFCDEGKIADAKNLWIEMVEKRIEPDIVSFNTLIGGYCDAGEVERAEELFREMEMNAIEPTCTTFEHLIKGHCKAGNVDAALLVFVDMRRRGHRPETATVDEVLDEMCERGMVTEGLGILRGEMRREGEFSPSRMSYELLIKGFCEKGELEEALKLQAEMAGRGYVADSKVYEVFIEGYRNKGDVEKAGSLKDEMIKFCMKDGD